MAADRPVTPESDPLVLDTMLGKLAVYLRMCGYDAAYAGDRGVEADDAVRALAREEGRRLLTRDAELAASLEDAVLLVERDPADQLGELRAAGFELRLPETPTRCGRCNGRLEPALPDAERPAYAPPPGEFDCWRCVDCDQWFWRGSHWDRVASLL
ncbi:MAG: Mut7-C RNAse domain-containing protein [Halobacteriales archaeon]|nr:Mut7-C RNAse domain-containing protein [Halobacteriales archaeon]